MRDDSHSQPGATPVPIDPRDQCVMENAQGEMQGYGYHRDQWIWNGSEWTDRVRCTTCGRVAQKTRSNYTTLEGTS